MSDVLAFTIELDDGKYASENNKFADGLARGRKSAIYKDVFRKVKKAAEDQMKRVRWTKASCECMFVLIRYMPKRWRADAVNLGTPEANALTKAGVWDDDRLGNPATLLNRHDPDGKHRVVIFIAKLHRPANVHDDEKAPRPKKESVPKAIETIDVTGVHLGDGITRGKVTLARAVAQWRPGDPIPNGFADFNGRLVPREEAIAKIRGEG